MCYLHSLGLYLCSLFFQCFVDVLGGDPLTCKSSAGAASYLTDVHEGASVSAQSCLQLPPLVAATRAAAGLHGLRGLHRLHGLHRLKCTSMDPGPLGRLEYLKAVRFGRCIFETFTFCTCLEYLHMCMYIYIYVYLYKSIYIYI